MCLIALDIKGAFDKVWNNGLRSKLISKGVCGKLLTWIRSYLTDRSIKVVLSGQSSGTLPISASLQQGSILAPLLFSIFINDLSDECENQLYLYAGDSTLFCEIKSTDDPKAITTSLNSDLERERERERESGQAGGKNHLKHLSASLSQYPGKGFQPGLNFSLVALS